MKMYKGFDKNMKCRGFQYEIGGTYETDEAKICELGFHACENPLDVLQYYDPANSRFCLVDLDANGDTSNDSKRVGRKIHIEAEIGINGLISAGVKFILDHIKSDSAREYNTGDRSVATNTGHCSVATNTGYYSAATNTGNYSAATNTGDYSAATNTGDRSVATNTGDYSVATNTGDRSVATNTGDYSAATNTGDRSAAVVSGDDSIAFVSGCQSKAKGAKGCWLVLTERGDGMHIVDVQAVMVDGETIKADTFYTLKDKKIIEATEE